jgi:hypothetical protein
MSRWLSKQGRLEGVNILVPKTFSSIGERGYHHFTYTKSRKFRIIAFKHRSIEREITRKYLSKQSVPV